MQKFGFLLNLVALAALGSGLHVHAESVLAPQRIITLSPSLAEVASQILGSKIDRIIGVSEYTDFPPVLSDLPKVGSYQKIQIEKIAQLKPDLILAAREGTLQDQVQRLIELKFNVVVVSVGSFEQIQESFVLIGNALGLPQNGEALKKAFEGSLNTIKKRSSGRTGPRPKIMLQVGAEPLVVAGKTSFLSEALEAIGAQNAFGDLASAYPRPSYEEVMLRNPDWILMTAMTHDPNESRQLLKMWSNLKGLKAQFTKQVRVIDARTRDFLLRPSPRLIEGLSRLEKIIWPQK